MSEGGAVDLEVRAELAAGRVGPAVHALVQGLGPEIYGFLCATLRDDDAAGDVFGMWSEDVLRGLATFRGDASLRTWSYALARHAAARWRRDPLRRRGVRADDASAVGQLVHELRSRTSVWRRTEVKDRVRALRDALEVEEQELLILRVDRAMEWDEVARALLDEGEEASEAAVKKKSAAARKRFERIKEKLKALAAKPQGG
ncbi:MAG: sigma-70 family RNA polymerase sigma factor [Deltaproteobacteria bacterium]|nr:sigma-70 family RNA polymerase sigma factor [Deltaproteobacteria bacterium]